MNNFEIHPKLKQDTLFVTEFDLSAVLLMNDERFPWVVLVPRKTGLTELHSLSQDELYQLLIEIKAISLLLQKKFHPDKLNVASIGNIVAQLHVHIVARYKADSVWPHPVFGQGVPIPYSTEKMGIIIDIFRKQLPIVMKDVLKEKI